MPPGFKKESILSDITVDVKESYEELRISLDSAGGPGHTAVFEQHIEPMFGGCSGRCCKGLGLLRRGQSEEAPTQLRILFFFEIRNLTF